MDTLRRMNDETLVATGRMTAEVVRKLGREEIKPEALADLLTELADRLEKLQGSYDRGYTAGYANGREDYKDGFDAIGVDDEEMTDVEEG